MAASKNPLIRLVHIREEIQQLPAAFEHIDFDRFAGNYILRRATEHAILIISEAVRTLPRGLTDDVPHIDWASVRGIGNVLRHDYFAIEPIVLWRIVRDQLPNLASAVAAMIVSLEDASRRAGL